MILDAEQRGAITPGKVTYDIKDMCLFMEVIVCITFSIFLATCPLHLTRTT